MSDIPVGVPKMSYRDYLILTATHAAGALNEAIATALRMHDEGEAIGVLEHRLDVTPLLVAYTNPHPDKVEARP